MLIAMGFAPDLAEIAARMAEENGGGVEAALQILDETPHDLLLQQQQSQPNANVATPASSIITASTSSSALKAIFVVNRGLKLSPGKIAAQVAHAALALARRNEAPSGVGPQQLALYRQWSQEQEKMVVVTTNSHQAETTAVHEMDDLLQKAHALQIPTVEIQDAGRTEVRCGTRTVIGFGPGPAHIIDQVSGDLRLLH